MPATQLASLLSLPAELRAQIYDDIFSTVPTENIDFSVKDATAFFSTLQICQLIRSEALPRLLHFVELRVVGLSETVGEFERAIRTAPMFSMVKLRAAEARGILREWRVLDGVLRLMIAVAEGGVQVRDVRRLYPQEMRLWMSRVAAVSGSASFMRWRC